MNKQMHDKLCKHIWKWWWWWQLQSVRLQEEAGTKQISNKIGGIRKNRNILQGSSESETKADTCRTLARVRHAVSDHKNTSLESKASSTIFWPAGGKRRPKGTQAVHTRGILKPAGAIWKTSGCHSTPVCAKVFPKRRLGTPGVSMYGTSVSIHRIWGAHLGGNCHQKTPKGGHLRAQKFDLSAKQLN